MSRQQRTISHTADVCGVGFLTGADVHLRFRPAPAGFGLVFQRIDLPGSPVVPAMIDYAVPRQRRTAIEHNGGGVEMTEHVLAALYGLQVDNCLIELNAPEPPGGDGSSLLFAEALLNAGIEEQHAPREVFVVDDPAVASDPLGRSEVTAVRSESGGYEISYRLDYGPDSPIPPQTATVEIRPETFMEELAFARTFIQESEIKALKAQGYGTRTTARDLLVFGFDGPIDNEVRSPDECARHKILDCVGDFALFGCDVVGRFSADRSGHELNREIVRRLKTGATESQPVGVAA